jgi:hypothetical protein
MGDSIGHSESINPATAVEFPKLGHKFGGIVTYGESPHGHIRTEFAFDVNQLADEAFAPPAYLHFIGFQVPRKFLERAFVSTYGFDIHEVLGRAHPALRSYRTSVRSFIPAFAEAELVLHRHQFPPHPDDETYRKFAERVARTNYERRWKHTYRGPGVKAHLLAILVLIIPKVGAVADLAIKIPNADTEGWYLQSVNHTVDAFHDVLIQSAKSDAHVELANLDLDTGKPAKAGDYALADEAYANLIERLTSKPNRIIPADVKASILQYFSGSAIAENSQKIQAQLDELKRMSTGAGIR